MAKPSKPWENQTAEDLQSQIANSDAPQTVEVAQEPIEPVTTLDDAVIADADVADNSTDTVETKSTDANVVTESNAIEGELLDMVVAVVPKQFILNLDHHKTFTYQAGTQRMERCHAEHWWAVANGVTIFEG